MSDLDKCPRCGGPADNGNDRCVPPSAYICTACSALDRMRTILGVFRSALKDGSVMPSRTERELWDMDITELLKCVGAVASNRNALLKDRQ